MRTLVHAAVAAALAVPLGAGAQSAGDIKSLRDELDALRVEYDARLKVLEGRLRAAEDAARSAPTAPTVVTNGPTSAQVPAPATTPASSAPDAGARGAAPGFNPAISLILSGLYANTSQDPAKYAITGFPLPPDAEIGLGVRGFSLAESELSFAANIDPWWSGAAHVALAPDNSLSVEEAWVQTSAVGHGLTLKAGRFFSGIGYLNPQHSHTWDFVDNPLAYQAMLGTQYGSDGVQLQWLAPTDMYLAFGAEVGRGLGYPGTSTNGNGAGMTALYVHAGGDVGESNSWRAGLSYLTAKAADQALQFGGADGVPGVFNGNTDVTVADFVWKWAPGGNATRTSFKLQGEYLRSRRDGGLLYGSEGLGTAGNFTVAQSGWYLQGVYQFMPGWRVGLRAERLDPGTPDYSGTGVTLAGVDYRPSKNTLMVDFNPSEFSRIRLQYARDRAQQGITDNQIVLQYQMSLGAHGAHSY